MKKIVIILAAAIIGLTSCGGGDGALKADTEKGVKLDCEIKALQKKIEAGDTTATVRLDKAMKELEDHTTDVLSRYKDKLDDKKFQEKAEKLEKEAKEKYCTEK